MEKVEEQVEALRKFAEDYPIPWEAICGLLGVEDGLKFEGPVFQALKKQLLEEIRDERESKASYKSGEFYTDSFPNRLSKIEQLRRNIENTLKIGYRWVSDLGGVEKEASKVNRKFNEMIDNNLYYYVEKLKEETEKMLKE